VHLAATSPPYGGSIEPPGTVCQGGYIFDPLYGVYGPYGGVGYWGAYTFSGWDYRQ
jgi:hypothetical protein